MSNKNKIKIITKNFKFRKRLYRRILLKKLREENFIETYPISLIGFVSTVKFWRHCYCCGIVDSSFEENEKKSNFEEELYVLCEKHMYSKEMEYPTEIFRKDVSNLFKKYKI